MSRSGLFAVILCSSLVAACTGEPEEQYKGLPPGGYIKETSPDTYDVFIVSREGEVNLTSGKYHSKVDIPDFLKRRLPMSVQSMFTIETEICGNIKFAEPLVGPLLCRSCAPHVLRLWKE